MENENTTVEPAVETTPGAESADPAALLAALGAERDQLAAEIVDLNDRLVRRQADFENSRRRAERDRSEIIEYASMESVKQLLPVLDDFERALQAAPEMEGAARDHLKGIELIYQRFSEALRKLGLEPFDTAGKPFDPNLHHAVEMVPDEQAEDHTVIGEYQRGYNFKSRLLRPAMVRVSVKP